MIRKRTWSVVVWLALALSALVPSAFALADGPAAAEWLKTQQNDDGGFGSPASGVGATADVLLAVAATGDNAIGWAPAGVTPLDYLKANVASSTKAGDMAKVVLALTASGQNPRTATGMDLVAKIEGMVGGDGKIGGDDEFVNEHCVAMIALSAASRPVPAASVSYLLGMQIADGTWSWNGDTTEGSGDNNTTAMVVIALIAGGVPADHAQIQKAVDHFKAQQNADGGFPYVKPSPYGTDSDSNSTAVVMWALIAAGQDPAGVDWKANMQDGYSALDVLESFQNDSGAFRWQDAVPADNLMSTVQAVIAMELKTLPFARMDVGEGPTAPEEPATTPVETLPETGVSLWTGAILLLGSGASLIAVGTALRYRTRRR